MADDAHDTDGVDADPDRVPHAGTGGPGGAGPSWDPPHPTSTPAMPPIADRATVDRGLDSVADLRALTRLLLWGLVAVVIVGAAVVVFGGRWDLLAGIVGVYAVVAASQWLAANRRARRARTESRPG